MEPTKSTLASYLPALQIQRVLERRSATSAPSSEGRHAALLFVDVAGFTPLTESLAQRGAVGAEQLSQALNFYFGRLTEIVHAHGGDVVAFAGDAALAIWPGSSSSLSREIEAATACALAIREALGGVAPAAGITLRQRAAVGAGPVSTSELGGLAGAWLFLVAGDAVRQTTAADAHAQVGDVVLAPEAWAQVAATCKGEELRGGYMRILSAPAGPRPEPPAPRATADLDELLRSYVPRAVRERLAAGHGEWIAEFRRVSVLFITLEDIDYADPGTLDRLQRAVRAMQETLERFEGSVYQFLMDDKGTTLLGAFGLPPLAIEHGAARASEAALEIHRALVELDVRSSIGVATGDAFCGVVGSEARRQYAIVGPVINLSARLMQAASGTIVCDEATATAARARVTFEALPAIRVKGRTEPVPVQRPIGRASQRAAPHRALIGRVAERANLGRQLEALREGRGALVWIEGEAGIGKSHLVADLAARADAAGVRVLQGNGDAVERATAYFAWRDVLARLLGPARDMTALRATLLARLAGDATRLERAPVLNTVLPLGLPETAVTRGIEGEARAESVTDLVAHLLHQVAATEPTLLIIDDLHWCDSTTWELLSAVRYRVPALLVVVATRPPEDPIPVALRRLRDDAGLRLPLAPLAVDDLPALIAQRFGVVAVPDELVRFILERAEGHPFYSEEMALALLDAGVIAVEDGACRVVAGPGGLSGIDFPTSVQGVITSRIDRLPPHEQLLMKTASVIGRVFAHRTLHDIYPVPGDRPRLRDGLDHLAHLDLTRLETPEPELAYVFKHAITQEVAYGSLLFAQRRQLHRAVAEWYEGAERDTATLAPLLAHHWEKAEEPLRAVDYLEQAGEQAVRSFANREAAGFLERALTLNQAAGERAGHARLAHWEQLLGEARIQLSDYNLADDHLRRAIALSDRPAAVGPTRITLALLGQVLRQVAHRLVPTGFLGRAAAAKRVDVIRAAAAHKRLAEVAWFNDRLLPMLYGIFTSLNLAERAGARRETADGYCSMGVVSGLVGLRGVARWYLDRATALVGDEPATIDLARTTVVFGIGVGDWARVEREATRGCEAYARMGNRFMWDACRGGIGFMHLHRGRFAEALACFDEVYESARHGALQSRLWARAGQCTVQLQTVGRVDPELVPAYEADLRRNAHHLDALVGEGTLALAALRAGDTATALSRARTALAMLRRSPPTVYYTVWSLAGVCEVFLSDAARQDRSFTPDDRRRAVRQTCGALDRFALMVPTARPRAALMAGRAALAAGRPRRARRRWRRGEQVADRLGLPYDGALLRLELALHQPSGDARARELSLAATQLAELGATYDSKRATEALG